LNFFKRKYYRFYLFILTIFSKDDVLFTKAKYFFKNNQKINLNHPIEFMEKIQWLKLNYYTSSYGYLVDKYEVRSFVEQKIGKKYLNEMYDVYTNVEAIDFSSLPNQFVLKGTHGSGYNIIVKNKLLINLNKVKTELNSFLNKNYYKVNRELIYKDVKPKILVEKYISEMGSDLLIDYKFYCFHGIPKYVLVKCIENNKEKKCFYDLNWNKIVPIKIPHDFLMKEVDKPLNFIEMKEVATKLAQDLIFVRVDLYSIDLKIIFGELTFFPTGGNKRLSVEKFNKEFGDLIRLPN